MTKLLELTSDVVFKSFMMSDKTKDYKARLIHLITGLPEKELREAKYESIELPISNKKDKIYKTDIIVKIEKNIKNIEMNKEYYEGLITKNSSYYNKIRSEEFDKGMNYLEVKKVIQINIDNFTKYSGNKLIYKFMMKEVETNEIETEMIESYHINLPYLKKRCYNKDIELEKLCRLFVIEQKEAYNLKGDVIMEEALNELEKISKDDKIIGLYDKEKVEEKIMNTKIEGAKLEGIKETKKEIVKKMLLKKIPIEQIKELTGITDEEIKEI